MVSFFIRVKHDENEWRPYGVLVDIDAPNFKKIVTLGTRTHDVNKKLRKTN